MKTKLCWCMSLLHGFGATDKYDLATGQPLYPKGYAEPALKPLYPQRFGRNYGDSTSIK